MASLLGAAYDSSDDETPQPNHTTAIHVVAAPDVSLEVWSHTPPSTGQSKLTSQQDPMKLQMTLAKPTDTSLSYNVPYTDLSRATQGPANPFKSTEGNALKRKNV